MSWVSRSQTECPSPIESQLSGAGVWEWAGSDDGTADPDIVLAAAGDIVTMETVAAAQILKERLSGLRVRVVNVVDLMTLIRPKDHPHGMSDTLFRELFTDTVDVVTCHRPDPVSAAACAGPTDSEPAANEKPTRGRLSAAL